MLDIPARAETVSIRPANLQDLDALVAVENRCFTSDRISRRSFRDLLTRPTVATVVAIAGGAIAGYAMLLFRQGTGLSRLYSICVDPAFAGRGIGRALMKAAENETFERGRMLLRLEVREDNDNAIRLYRGLGYRPIGRNLDYYADHTNALRFEKTVRGDVPVAAPMPYYEQTTDFTCGPCCLMMALARWKPGFELDPVVEIRLWREATTVFMMSGLGGCDPYGLAVAAHEAGLAASIHVSDQGILFLDTVRDAEKRMVMELAQTDFRKRVAAHGIPVGEALTLADIRLHLAGGRAVVTLVSGYLMFGKKVPHWVIAHGDDGRHILIHDPWVEDEVGETIADAANLPIPYEQFERMARFGRSWLRAAVVLGPR